MTGNHIITVLTNYQTLLRNAGIVPERMVFAHRSRERELRYAAWMIDEALQMLTYNPNKTRSDDTDPRYRPSYDEVTEPITVSQARLEKAFRWLGFIQGILWCTCFRSVNDMRGDNTPPE